MPRRPASRRPRLYLSYCRRWWSACSAGWRRWGLPLPSPVAVPGPDDANPPPTGLYNSNHMARQPDARCAADPRTPSRHLTLSGAGCPRPPLPAVRSATSRSWGRCRELALPPGSSPGAAHRRDLPPVARRLDRARCCASGRRWSLVHGSLGRPPRRPGPALLHERLAGLQPLSSSHRAASCTSGAVSAAPPRSLLLRSGTRAGENLRNVHVLSGRMRFVHLENRWLQLLPTSACWDDCHP